MRNDAARCVSPRGIVKYTELLFPIRLKTTSRRFKSTVLDFQVISTICRANGLDYFAQDKFAEAEEGNGISPYGKRNVVPFECRKTLDRSFVFNGNKVGKTFDVSNTLVCVR